MLEATEKFQGAFEKLEFEDNSYSDCFGTLGSPTNLDWEKARAFTKFLKIFYDAINVFSSSQHVSIHSAFHQLAIVCSKLNHCILSPDSIMRAIGVRMKEKYDKYWGNFLNMNHLLYFGVILDPRYKFMYVEWFFKEDIYPNDPLLCDTLTTAVKDSLYRIYNWYASIYNKQNRTVQIIQNVESQAEISGPEMQRQLALTDANKQHLKLKSCIDQQNELERYLSEACVSLDDKFDVLQWWKQNSAHFSVLSAMARDVLAVPVSTMAFESVFSTGGRVLDTFRSSLNPEMAEALICTQNWLRPSLQVKELNVMEELESSEKIVAEIRGGSLEFIAALGVEPSTQQHPMTIG